jgi:hypothetical protein
MNDERIKKAVLEAIERGLDARSLATAVRDAGSILPPRPESKPPPVVGAAPTTGTKKLLTKIVLGDILADDILGARPHDRTFPLRLFFSELGTVLAKDDSDEASDIAFAFASGLNFFFRAPMEPERKMWVGVETSRQLYALAAAAKLESDLVEKATPLLAALMTNEIQRIKFESVDHMKVFDSSLHERAEGSDATASRIVRPASFLCRVAANNAVKAKAEVVT